jgi:DNA replication protein DnaC
MALDDDLRTRMRELGLWGLIARWDELGEEDVAWLVRLAEWEEAERQRRSLERRLRTARIGRFKPLADFDWEWPEHCEREAVEGLMALEFVAEGANAVLVGPNGIGKSTIARNVAHTAVLAGHTVRFTTASEMLNDLAAQEGASALQRRLRRYTQPRLLVVDELGYLAYGNRHADLLFEVVSRRYGEKPVLVTTNKAFSEWGEVFSSATCVVTLVDRLVHRCDVIELKGESYRLKEAQEREARKKRERARRRSKPDAP